MLTKKEELLLLSSLRDDARQSLTLLSRRIRIPVSTIHEKLKRYQHQVIQRHTALLNFSSLGFSTQVTLLLSVGKEDRERMKEYLFANKSVNSCYRINNGFDFFVEAVFQNMHEAEHFVDEIEKEFHVLDKRMHYVIDELKREAFLSSPDYVRVIENK